MNKWVKVPLGVVATFVLAILAVFYFTSGMVDTADAFFNAAHVGWVSEAKPITLLQITPKP